jgi:hypothetical protein
MEPPDCSSPEELHGPLIELLRGHAIAAQAQGEWVTFPDYPGRVQGLIFNRKDVHPLCSTQVDIRFSPWPGCLIRESFSGIGASREERIQESLAVFARNTLHVLLKVFFGADCGDQTNEWKLANQGVPRTITDGNVYCRGTGPFEPKLNWVEGFHRMLASQPLSEGTHWLRLYFAQIDRQPNALELLLDNEPWTGALATARSLPWPLSSGFFSCRMFLVIQGGVDVSRAIGLLAQHAEADDERLQELLVAAGFSAVDSRRIIVLAPIAFGGRLLEGLGVVISTVCILDDSVSRKTIDLQSSHIYQESCFIASNAQGNSTMSGEEFFAVAGRDARVQAVNTALNAGSNLRDVKLAPLIIFWREGAPLCPTSKSESASTDKSWRRFWRRSERNL